MASLTPEEEEIRFIEQMLADSKENAEHIRKTFNLNDTDPVPIESINGILSDCVDEKTNSMEMVREYRNACGRSFYMNR